MQDAQARIDLPADPVWTHLARSVVAATADPTRFDLDRLDDLSLAVGEVVTTLIDVDGAARIHLAAASDADAVEVTVTISGEELGAEEGGPSRHGLLDYVLQSLASEVIPAPEGGPPGISFRIRAR